MAGRNLQNLVVPAAIVVGGLSFILLGLYIPDRNAGEGGESAEGERGAAPVEIEGAGEARAPAGGSERAGGAVEPASELTLAIRADDVGAVVAALDGGADANERLPEHVAGLAGTPLMLAAREARPEIVAELLRRGADVEARSPSGATPLMLAAQRSEPDTVLALLNAGADVNARTDSGRTPLIAAAAAGSTASLRALLEAGAEVDAADAGGVTALMHAVDRRDRDGVLAMLNAGASPSRVDGSGRSAVDRAPEGPLREILREAAGG